MSPSLRALLGTCLLVLLASASCRDESSCIRHSDCARTERCDDGTCVRKSTPEREDADAGRGGGHAGSSGLGGAASGGANAGNGAVSGGGAGNGAISGAGGADSEPIEPVGGAAGSENSSAGEGGV